MPLRGTASPLKVAGPFANEKALQSGDLGGASERMRSREEYSLTADKSSHQRFQTDVRDKRGIKEEAETAGESSGWRQQKGLAGTEKVEESEDSVRLRVTGAGSSAQAAIKKEIKFPESQRVKQRHVDSPGSPPVFLKEISSLKVKTGEMTEFTCQFQGDPPPVVSWLKDGQSLDRNPDYDIMIKSNNSKLTVFYPTTDHEGTYDIYEEGAVDFVTQEHDDLKIAFEVTEMPPRFINPICDMETPEGTTVMFECSLMGIPSPIVSWFKGDKKIPHNTKKYLHSSDGDNHFLKICKVTTQDSGVYTCRAINLVGETLLKKPDISHIQPVRCSEGGEVYFNYKTTGDPVPDVKWLKGAFQIQPSRNCIIVTNPDGSGLINIKSVKQEDSGLYTCKASNQFGEATCIIRKPSFVRTFEPTSAAVNDPLKLECHVCGSAPLKVQWMKDRKELSSAGSIRLGFSDGTASLEISSASKHDAGDYLCKATNEAGAEFCKAKVTVKGKTRTASCSSANKIFAYGLLIFFFFLIWQTCRICFSTFIIIYSFISLQKSDYKCCVFSLLFSW
uniref:Ig-like domain-containing protein n=1 Tax=Poecilia mexicana TaxID=48701 RepID=A0A3B3YTQ6_9TELE